MVDRPITSIVYPKP